MQIVIAILTLALITIAFGLCGYLFLTLKRELYSLDQRREHDASAAQFAIDLLRKQIGELEQGISALPAHAPWPPPGNGINLNKRTQALKMMRLGEGPEHIAAALSLPRNEIELLAKVQQMLIDSAQPSTF
jgi:hypothetical protein